MYLRNGHLVEYEIEASKWRNRRTIKKVQFVFFFNNLPSLNKYETMND